MMSSQPSVPESLTRFNNLLLTGSPAGATDRSSPGQYVGYLKDRSHSWRASLCGAVGSSPEPMLHDGSLVSHATAVSSKFRARLMEVDRRTSTRPMVEGRANER